MSITLSALGAALGTSSIGSALGSAFSAVAPSALSFGGNMLTSAINASRQWKYTRRAMELADRLNRSFTHDVYGIQRSGLKAAGYNPLLALGTPATGAVYGNSAGMADSDNGSQAVQSAMDALRLRNENKITKSQVTMNESQSDLNTQLTYKAYADEFKSRAEANVASATEAQIYNNIRWENLLNDERLKQIIAETRFTNERARGFSASSSESKTYGLGGSGSAGKGKFKVGSFGINGNYGTSKSSSTSW